MVLRCPNWRAKRTSSEASGSQECVTPSGPPKTRAGVSGSTGAVKPRSAGSTAGSGVGETLDWDMGLPAAGQGHARLNGNARKLFCHVLTKWMAGGLLARRHFTTLNLQFIPDRA